MIVESEFIDFPGFCKRPLHTPADTETVDLETIVSFPGRYSETQSDELVEIAESTEPYAYGDQEMFIHDDDDVLLHDGEGDKPEEFTHAQVVSGRAGEIVTARLSKRGKLLVGAIATVTFGFGFGFLSNYLSNHEGGSTDKAKLCTEQVHESTKTDPNAVAVQVSDCRANQILGR